MGKGKEKGSKASSASSSSKAANDSASRENLASKFVCRACDKEWVCRLEEYYQHKDVDCPKVKTKTNTKKGGK